jgi:hypothetical protein
MHVLFVHDQYRGSQSLKIAHCLHAPLTHIGVGCEQHTVLHAVPVVHPMHMPPLQMVLGAHWFVPAPEQAVWHAVGPHT